jgi:hypothetical protein
MCGHVYSSCVGVGFAPNFGITANIKYLQKSAVAPRSDPRLIDSPCRNNIVSAAVSGHCTVVLIRSARCSPRMPVTPAVNDVPLNNRSAACVIPGSTVSPAVNTQISRTGAAPKVTDVISNRSVCNRRHSRIGIARKFPARAEQCVVCIVPFAGEAAVTVNGHA